MRSILPGQNYAISKWRIEGFIEAVAREVAPFGIDFIIAEPGPTATNFGAGLVHADPMTEYERTPAGEVRRAISSGSFVLKGDAGRTAAAVIAAANEAKPALRLALGSTAYNFNFTSLVATPDRHRGPARRGRLDRSGLIDE